MLTSLVPTSVGIVRAWTVLVEGVRSLMRDWLVSYVWLTQPKISTETIIMWTGGLGEEDEETRRQREADEARRRAAGK